MSSPRIASPRPRPELAAPPGAQGARADGPGLTPTRWPSRRRRIQSAASKSLCRRPRTGIRHTYTGCSCSRAGSLRRIGPSFGAAASTDGCAAQPPIRQKWRHRPAGRLRLQSAPRWRQAVVRCGAKARAQRWHHGATHVDAMTPNCPSGHGLRSRRGAAHRLHRSRSGSRSHPLDLRAKVLSFED